MVESILPGRILLGGKLLDDTFEAVEGCHFSEVTDTGYGWLDKLPK